jgi:hypothetical protein
MFLRGETGLSTFEIYQQIYRPWLWGQHLHQFITSPNLMGWGSVEFNVLKTEDLVSGHEELGDVSLPTRLLAQYGLPGLLFVVFMIARLRVLAKRGDVWGCACFPVVVLGLFQWGSMFHPTDPMFVIYMIIMIHGSAAFGPMDPRARVPERAARLRMGMQR